MSDHINHECGIALIRLKKPLQFYNDKYGTPTYTFDFAKNTRKLIESNNFGLFKSINIENLPTGNYILEISKKIPLYGEIVSDKNFNYKVLSHSRKQISRVEISKIN